MIYVLVDVYKFWDYSVTRFNKGDGGRFAEYVNVFLKLKQESLDYLPWIRSDAYEKKY
jgi:hypothetical protein